MPYKIADPRSRRLKIASAPSVSPVPAAVMALTAIRTVFRAPRMTLGVADDADGADANVAL
jgi:hypothetical protein